MMTAPCDCGVTQRMREVLPTEEDMSAEIAVQKERELSLRRLCELLEMFDAWCDLAVESIAKFQGATSFSDVYVAIDLPPKLCL